MAEPGSLGTQTTVEVLLEEYRAMYALIWVLRTTITHACSFEDAIRRIDQIESAVNALIGAELMRFQSHHPSRGRATGGRTGAETIRSVLIAGLLVLLACGWLARPVLAEIPHGDAGFASFLGMIGVVLVVQFVQYRKYRYAPGLAVDSNTDCGGEKPCGDSSS